MPKRKAVPKIRKSADTVAQLGKALAKRPKTELVEIILELARADRPFQRQLELRFKVEPPAKDLVAATRQAIADATDFDERDMNRNFDYDYAAYEAVKRNFGRLIDQGHLRAAMELSLDLMSQGSYQVEMSDEGMMTDDIEDCVQVVIKALGNSDLPAGDVSKWCDAMAKQDRGGFICRKELGVLRNRVTASR